VVSCWTRTRQIALLARLIATSNPLILSAVLLHARLAGAQPTSVPLSVPPPAASSPHRQESSGLPPPGPSASPLEESSAPVSQDPPASSAPVQLAAPIPGPPQESVPAAEPPTPFEAFVPFGSPGQWVVMGSSTGAGISYETFSASDVAFFSASVAIGVDRFVARNLSIGIDLDLGYRDSKGYGATSFDDTWSTQFGAGIRFGVNVPFGPLWSWYPRASFGLESDHTNTVPISEFVEASFPPASSSSRVGPWMRLGATGGDAARGAG